MRSVIKLANGEVISVADLPHPHVKWTCRRKWIVAQAVRFHLLEYDEACRRYWMHPEELDQWIETARLGDEKAMMLKAVNPARGEQTHGSKSSSARRQLSQPRVSVVRAVRARGSSAESA